ncbi:hypothetical protein Tco_0838253 [Tanacetum coccineum]|uniref:Reverse transcriptase Ty1/copia-type domain-containing protein n=1 Tax=Tanacetum coccineum TaxID=301880 RepID=A0ABQ5AN97_9ASTR
MIRRNLVTDDGEGADWTNHSEDEDYALDGLQQLRSETEVAVFVFGSGGYGLKKVEAQLAAHQQGQLCTKPSELVSEPVVIESNVESQPKVWFDAPIIEVYELDSDDECLVLLGEKGKLLLSPQQVVVGDHKYTMVDPNTIVDPVLEIDYPHRALKNKGIVDSGCSRHMTGNKAYLDEFQDFNGGPVAFGKYQLPKLYKTFWVAMCHLDITIGKPFGKFDGVNQMNGFLVGYSLQSKGLSRVSNLERKELKKTYTITFLENNPNVAGKGPTWLFDLDYLTDSMNYHPVSSENQANLHAGQQEANQNAGDPTQQFKQEAKVYYQLWSSCLKPKKISEALEDESWVDAMQEELLQFEIQQVWVLVDLPYGKKAIGTKWVYQNKKDERGVVVRNKQVYVDDIIFGSTKKSWCDEFEALMKSRFQMSSMGELTFFLGLQVKQKEDVSFTPIETQKPLVKDEEASDVDVHLYRSMIGSLMYLTASRPDIMFAVCACSRFQVTPKTSHLSAVKRIFSDYARANLDKKSTTGGCQFLGRRLISWQCKKQTIVATSTTEAEYVAAASCCGQVLWIQNQMLDYGFNFMNTKIYIDNESTICIVKNPVLKIHTDDNVADLLTKAFDVSRGVVFVRELLGRATNGTEALLLPTLFLLWLDKVSGTPVLSLLNLFKPISIAQFRTHSLSKPHSHLQALITTFTTLSISRTLAVLDSCPKHNMVAYLEKTEGNEEFHDIIDFLKRSSILFDLTVSPTISTTFVEQFWTSAKSITINNVRHITANVPIEHQPNPSPRPSPTNTIPASIPETSGDNLGGHSSSDKSLSGNEGDMTIQGVYDLCLSLCKQVSDQAKEIQALKAQITKLKKQAKPVIKHHKAYLKSVSLKQRFPRKSFSKKHRVHKEYVSKQGRKFAKGESSVQRDQLFDEMPEDKIDHMEIENAQSEGRRREMGNEDKDIDERMLSTEDVLSTDKEGVSTDFEKVSTDRPIVSTDGSKVSTDRQIEGTEDQVKGTDEHNEGTEDKNEGTEEIFEGTEELREGTEEKLKYDGQVKGTEDQTEEEITTQTSTLTLTSMIFGDDETIAKVLLNMSKAKAVSKEKEKGVELKDVEETDRPRPTSTRSLLTLKPLPKIDPKDKGKKKMKEEMKRELERVGLSKSEVIKEESKEEVQKEVKDEESTRKRKIGTRKKMKSRKRRYIQYTSEDDSDKENDELRLYLTIAQDEEKEVDYEILDRKYPIKEWKTECLGAKPQTDQAEHLEEINLNVVIRSNGQKRYFSTLMTVLSIFDREDLNAVYQLVMDKYQDEMPEGFDRVLWGDLMVLFNSDDKDMFWSSQIEWIIVSWKLHSALGVHTLVTDTGLVIHMLVEKKYPLRKKVLKQMLKLKLGSEEENTMALELIKFVKKILAVLEIRRGEIGWD